MVGHLPQIRDEMLQQQPRQGRDLPSRIISGGALVSETLCERDGEASRGSTCLQGSLGSPPHAVIRRQGGQEHFLHISRYSLCRRRPREYGTRSNERNAPPLPLGETVGNEKQKHPIGWGAGAKCRPTDYPPALVADGTKPGTWNYCDTESVAVISCRQLNAPPPRRRERQLSGPAVRWRCWGTAG